MQKLSILVFCLLIAGLVTVFYSTGEAQDESLILWFPFEGSGDAAEDLSGNGNDGAIVGASRVNGKYRKGISTGKADEYIEISIALETKGTIEFWFKPNWDGSDAESYRIFDASTAAIFFCVGKGAQVGEREDELLFCFEDAADTDFYMPVLAADVIAAGKWHHLAATWDFEAKEAKFYINGEESAMVNGLGDFPPLDPKPRIGFNNQHGYKVAANGADGVIDEFAIYTKVLEPDEIKQDMEKLAYAVEPSHKLPVIWGKIKSEH